ncbi:MAG: efflux RND transporter permease subunit [Robiginitomaculum sp.]|nr:efflux RND transporter permease subunit [Robiginitomaculum sp.]
MTGIVDFAVHQWRMTLALLAFSVIGGFLAMFSISLDAEPDVAIPFVTVQVVLPGVSPEDSERLLVKPLENELKSLDGIKQLDGIGRTSVGLIILEFNANFDQDSAVDDVTEAVNKARGELPLEAKEPLVEELNTQTLPIIVVNLFGDAPERKLQNLAKELRSAYESNPRILEAKIQGEREDLLEAVIDPSLMESYGITFNELAVAVANNNKLVTAGSLETKSGKFSVKLPGLIANASDLASIVVRSSPDGSIVRISDIADVRRTYKDRESYALFQSRPSVSLEISKRSGENIIETIKEIRAITAELTKDWPDTVQVELSQDQTVQILDMIRSLVSSIINAVVLVFIVCIVALGLRSALMVGFAIPASFLMTIFMFKIQGASINMMVMFGMILSVGILVDSAIVIIEYADRKLAEGLDRKEAYTLAGKRMFWPIVSSTATTLAAFLPLLFWNTLPGQFMSYFPKTLIYVLSASLLMALIFLPTLGALFGPKKLTDARTTLAALSGADGHPLEIKGFTGNYARMIDKLARRPLLVLVVILALVFSIFKWFGATEHNIAFFTANSGDEIYVYGRTRGNTATVNEYDIAKQIEARINGIDGIKSVFTIAGAGAASGGGFRGPSSVPLDTVSRTFLELQPFAQRRPTQEIETDVRAALTNMPGLQMEVEVISDGPPVGKDVTIELTSNNLDKLNFEARKVSQYMENNLSMHEVENTMPLPGIEWQLNIDREEAGRLGVNVSTIGAAVQFVTEGSLVGFFRPLDSDEEVDIRIRFPNTERDLSHLDNVRIQTRDGALPLSSVVTRTAKPRQDAIARRNQKRVYEIKGNVRDGIAINQVVDSIKTWMANAGIDDDVQYKFLGQDEENKEAGEFFAVAGVATLFMMGIILLLQFNSFWHVLLTLSAVVFSIAGVLLGLQFYPYISIILCGTGVLALAGIVVNNNIVLIDTFQYLKREGRDTHDAVVHTAAQRLRPVLLTTITTIIGLMPMVLAVQADLFSGVFSTRGTSTSAIWAPISYVLVCGLGFSTILTLILTPVMLAAPTVWGRNLSKLFNRKSKPLPNTVA